MGAALHIVETILHKMGDPNAAYRNIHQHLIDGCKSGDQKAQFQIYKLYFKAMYNTSLRIVGNTMEAEDIMQESFLSAFEKIETYSGKVSFGAWLKKIVINRSLDALNRQKAILEDIDSHHELHSLHEESSDNLDNIDVRIEEVRAAIENLPDGYRIILSLYLLEGYDHDEISEILSITSSTSRSQLSRAKQKLVSELRGSI